MACPDLCLEASPMQVLEQTLELFGSRIIVYGLVSLKQCTYVLLLSVATKENIGEFS